MNSVLLILSLHYSVSLKARHHYYRMLNVTYVPQAVALLHGRNIWVKIAVLRKSRREQHAIFNAQHFSPQVKSLVARLFSTGGNFLKHFFSNFRRSRKLF